MKERGAALLIAIAAAGLIAVLAAAAAPMLAGETRRAEAALARAQAARVAEGAVHRLIAALATPGERAALPRDGAVVEARFMDARVTLSAQDVAGLVDLNAAPPAMLTGLLRATGAPEPQARAIATTLAARRAEARFAAPEAALAGLSEADAAALRAALPFATVWSGAVTVDRFTAPAPALAAAGGVSLAEAQAHVATRAALGLRTPPPDFDRALLASGGDGARKRLTALVETDAGGRAQAEAVVEVPGGTPDRWRVLAWR